ncbi:MAG: HD domain-containing protein [Bacteroidales bacterium]|nr:HD domain-containing protein [Bacteroidales bacterium]
MDYNGVFEYMKDILQKGLNSSLFYHTFDHTLDVITAAERLCGMENVGGTDLLLVKTAALFHDSGFLETYDEHEEISAQLASKILPGWGYNGEDIRAVASMIHATRLPQKPGDMREMILSDADLDYLGRDDMFMISQKLHYEWRLHGKITSLREWHEHQLQFIEGHRFFTRSATRLREERKQENIRELRELLCLKK